MTPSVGKVILQPFERFFLCASHVANWLRWSRGSGDTFTHSGHLTTKKKKSMKAREWGRAKGGEIYKWINQWTPSPASQTSPHPSLSWTPQMCVCAADKRQKTNWSSTTPTAFGKKKEKKMMAFTCRNYWRAAGPDQLTSFVSVAHEGPVEKLPLEIGSSGGEVMDCTLLASQPLPPLPFSFCPPKGALCTWLPKHFFFLVWGRWDKKWKNGKKRSQRWRKEIMK